MIRDGLILQGKKWTRCCLHDNAVVHEPRVSAQPQDKNYGSELHHEATFGAAVGVLWWHLCTPQSVEVAVGIDGDGFAVEPDAHLWRVVLVEIAYYASNACLQTYEPDVVLWSHRMRLRADVDLDGMT